MATPQLKRLGCLLFAISAAMPLAAQTTGRYIVSLRSPSGGQKLQLVSNAAEAARHDVRTFQTAPFLAASLTDEEATALKRSPDVAWLTPVVERHVSDWPAGREQRISSTTRSHVQTVPWGIDRVHAREVWPYTRGASVNVAVIDTGIDYKHPDLAGRYAGGYNSLDGSAEVMDDFSHGTHVSGTIAADDNGFGVVGVAPDVRLWAVKALDRHGAGTDESVMLAIDWVIAKKREIGGRWIINMSLGAVGPSDGEGDLVARALAEDILIVAAAGNASVESLDYPAGYAGVVSVAAIDSKNSLADFSSFGAGLILSAPGVDVLSTVPVGWVESAAILNGASVINALPLQGSALGEISGTTVFCGIGKPEEIPLDVRGKIAIVRRGELWFRDKTRNVLEAGAVGVIIVPPLDDADRPNWTLVVSLPDTTYPWPIVLSTNKEDGEALVANAGSQVVTLSYDTDDYTVHQGTSMATPHVTGAAALAWSLAPSATARQIAAALKVGASELGEPGYDSRFGFGRVDALATAKAIAPGVFGLPPVALPTGRRRSADRSH